MRSTPISLFEFVAKLNTIRDCKCTIGALVGEMQMTVKNVEEPNTILMSVKCEAIVAMSLCPQ